MCNVLDHGFIYLVDSMGSDSDICAAARVSHQKHGEERSDKDNAKLIRYLWANNHGTPFEMVQTKWHIKCPIFVARQWHRHRTWGYNEISARYSEIKDEYYVPPGWRRQSTTNKQGSSDEAFTRDEEDALYDYYTASCDESIMTYKDLLGAGVSKEMARMVLPQSMYTEFYGTVNLRNLLHFITLRSDPHAQWEIRQYAHAMAAVVEEEWPMTWEAYTNA